MRVAVTGAAGFIGSHIANAMPHDVVAFDNERSGDWSRLDRTVERHEVDICDPSEGDWEDLLGDVDTLFHLAAEKYNSSVTSPQRVVDTNISATARLFRGAARAGVRRIVFTSSLYAYGSLGPDPMRETDVLAPTTYYGMSKAAGEHLLRVVDRDHGIEWACARLFFVYGPRQHAQGGYKSVILTNFERIARGQPPRINGSGNQRLDYVYIDDVVDALIRLADGPPSITVNIGSGQAPTVSGLTAAMQDVADVHTPPVHVQADWTEGTLRVSDSALAHSLIGWRATTPLSEGLGRVWNWLRDCGS